jgi:murein DD-endopeptidase MepM/ murein hydrolase activator NlpD
MLRILGREVRIGLFLKLFLACLMVCLIFDMYLAWYNLPRVRANMQQEMEVRAQEETEIRRIYGSFSPIHWWDGPFRAPVKGKLLSVYGNRRVYNGVNLGTYHSGYDFSANGGTPVKAAAPGRVIVVRPFAIRGLTVVIDHGRGVFTSYYHLSKAGVSEGQMVDVGDEIGRVGTTGRSQGNHLHFELAVGGSPVDPGYWLQTALP